MKSLICISHVPDTTTKIQYDGEGKGLDKTGVTFVIGPYDEYGLVRGIEFKEQSGQGHVTALCVGSAEVEPTLRKALAIGADDAVRIDAEPKDSLTISRLIADYAEGKGFDFIFCGKESIADNKAEIPGMVAELLGLPLVASATKLEVEGDKAILHRELDGGYEVVESPLPMVVSCQKGIAEWRIPNMRGIMMAKRKPLKVETPASEIAPATAPAKYELPPAKGECVYIDPDTPEKLVELLNDKGLV